MWSISYKCSLPQLVINLCPNPENQELILESPHYLHILLCSKRLRSECDNHTDTTHSANSCDHTLSDRLNQAQKE